MKWEERQKRAGVLVKLEVEREHKPPNDIREPI
jgi:hypothetical protein